MTLFYAHIDSTDTVTSVLLIPLEACLDDEGNFDESIGSTYCLQFATGEWVRTCRFGSVRKNYGFVGSTYDRVRDAFIAPKPIPEAVLNEETLKWEIPEEVRQRYIDSLPSNDD